MRYVLEAGWPAYLVIGYGLASLWFALRHALMPQRNLPSLIVGLGAASVLMAVLGTALGIDATIDGTMRVPPDERWIALVGLKESLRNIEISLVLAVPTVLLATVGTFRLRSEQKP